MALPIYFHLRITQEETEEVKAIISEEMNHSL